MNTFPRMHWWFEAMDAIRRARGEAMDRNGLGPEECPFEEVLTLPGFRLRFYGGESTPGDKRVALIVPAPIKRHYIWDLAPECSVVRRAMEEGMQVYLIEWTDPGPELAAAGLDQYACSWIDLCIDAIQSSDPTTRPILFSHSLGGVLATIYAVLHPHRVAGLVLLEAPLHFGKASGSMFPMLATAPRAEVLTRGAVRIPGSFISMASANASPTTFQAERSADFWSSLGSRALLRRHLKVERWTLDEAPMAARLFEQVVEDLYREDLLIRGELVVDGQTIGPQHLKTPSLAVYDPRSLIIPPAAVVTFLKVSKVATNFLCYEGDVGIALSHVGTLVGPSAHRKLWPDIFAWTESVSGTYH